MLHFLLLTGNYPVLQKNTNKKVSPSDDEHFGDPQSMYILIGPETQLRVDMLILQGSIVQVNGQGVLGRGGGAHGGSHPGHTDITHPLKQSQK